MASLGINFVEKDILASLGINFVEKINLASLEEYNEIIFDLNCYKSFE